jgi:NTE family protein
VLIQSIMVVQRTITAHEGRNADIVIRPKVGHIRWDEMGRAAETLAAGEEAARESLPDIKALLAPAVEEHTTWIQRLLHRPTTATEHHGEQAAPSHTIRQSKHRASPR